MAPSPTAVIGCPAGKLRGVDRDTAQVFTGIRFADAERFEAPQDALSWDGTFDATRIGAQAPQNLGALEQLLGASTIPISEDCLHLNVFTPACDDRARPVLVWIHGGAFVTGNGAMPWYDGAALATRGDVVVVTVNYRLGAFGFLGDRNCGVLDQVSALRWVSRNIAAFGGDPDNVTAFGESAGGSALLALLATPSADALMHRAFAMSPSILQLRDAGEAAELAADFFDLIGSADVEHLRTSEVDAILDAQSRFPVASAGLRNFSPTGETDTIPEPILAAAAADRRPVVIGTNRDEMLLFTAFDPSRAHWDDGHVAREFARRFGDRADDAITVYRRHRGDTSASQLVSAMQTDEVFRVPAQRLASERATSDNPTWMYAFDYRSPAFGGSIGACHGLDIPFAFDNLAAHGATTLTGDRADRQPVADRFATAIVDFARTGDPGWPAYDETTRATQRIGPDPVVVKDPEPELRELWR